MAVTRSAAKTATRGTANKPVREGVTMPMFVWEGTDKRGKKMKGEQQSRSANMLRAELRRQGIQPHVVKLKPLGLVGGHEVYSALLVVGAVADDGEARVHLVVSVDEVEEIGQAWCVGVEVRAELVADGAECFEG